MSASDDEYMRLIHLNQTLTAALEEVRVQIAALSPVPLGGAYDIALRPDEHGADPFGIETLMDDIVVNKPAMFRAEQMDKHNWWVCCYLDTDTHERICWSVTAHSRPNRIEWVTTELPRTAIYEHEIVNRSTETPDRADRTS